MRFHKVFLIELVACLKMFFILLQFYSIAETHFLKLGMNFLNLELCTQVKVKLKPR